MQWNGVAHDRDNWLVAMNMEIKLLPMIWGGGGNLNRELLASEEDLWSVGLLR